MQQGRGSVYHGNGAKCPILRTLTRNAALALAMAMAMAMAMALALALALAMAVALDLAMAMALALASITTSSNNSSLFHNELVADRSISGPAGTRRLMGRDRP